MGFLIVIIIIGIFLFINIKISNLKYRAEQQILKNTGASSSDINAGITGSLEKKHLEKFLSEHSEYTEETIKDLMKQYTVQLFNKEISDNFSQEVKDKAQNDSKLEKMKTMEFRRANINRYENGKLNAVVVYTDNRDEYNVYLSCSILDNKIQLDKYQINKGAVVGF